MCRVEKCRFIKLQNITQIILNIEDPKEANLIKKLLAKFDSVTIAKPSKRKIGLDKALEDVKAGRVHKASSVDDLINQLND